MLNEYISEYNSFCKSKNLKTRLCYDNLTNNLYLCTEEGLELGRYYSKIFNGVSSEAEKVVKAMKMQLYFELGE